MSSNLTFGWNANDAITVCPGDCHISQESCKFIPSDRVQNSVCTLIKKIPTSSKFHTRTSPLRQPEAKMLQLVGWKATVQGVLLWPVKVFKIFFVLTSIMYTLWLPLVEANFVLKPTNECSESYLNNHQRTFNLPIWTEYDQKLSSGIGNWAFLERKTIRINLRK